MDKSASRARPAPPGVSIRHGAVSDRMDIDSTPNGTAKRKSRSSVGQTAVKYKEESDSDDGAPLVGRLPLPGVSTDSRGLTNTGQTSEIEAPESRARQRR
jgi:hypothetical protein